MEYEDVFHAQRIELCAWHTRRRTAGKKNRFEIRGIWIRRREYRISNDEIRLRAGKGKGRMGYGIFLTKIV